MFKKPESVVKKHAPSDSKKNVASIDDQKSLLEKIKTDRVQYELTDTGVLLNPYRFLSLKSILKERQSKQLTPSEAETPSASPKHPTF